MVIVDFYSVHNEIFILNLSNLRRGVFFYRKQNTTTRIQKKTHFRTNSTGTLQIIHCINTNNNRQCNQSLVFIWLFVVFD